MLFSFLARLLTWRNCLSWLDYIEELPHFKNRDSNSRSYTTRIRHTQTLRDLFDKLTIDLHDIDTHANEECIILHDKYVDDPDDDTIRKIEYNDKDLSPDELALSIQSEISFKPIIACLNVPYIDIPSYTSSTFTRTIRMDVTLVVSRPYHLALTTSL